MLNLPPDFQLVSAKHIVLYRSSDDLSFSYWHSSGSEAFFVTWELFHVFSVLLKNERVCRRPHKALSRALGAWAPVTGNAELLLYEHLAPVMKACADPLGHRVWPPFWRSRPLYFLWLRISSASQGEAVMMEVGRTRPTPYELIWFWGYKAINKRSKTTLLHWPAQKAHCYIFNWLRSWPVWQPITIFDVLFLSAIEANQRERGEVDELRGQRTKKIKPHLFSGCGPDTGFCGRCGFYGGRQTGKLRHFQRSQGSLLTWTPPLTKEMDRSRIQQRFGPTGAVHCQREVVTQ